MYKVTNLPTIIPRPVIKYSNKLEFEGELYYNDGVYSNETKFTVSDPDDILGSRIPISELVKDFISINVPWGKVPHIKTIKITIEIEDK